MGRSQKAISCSIMRGGTSRGAYILASDVPQDPHDRDRVLTAIMGGPDALQIDGLGGGYPLTSKVAIVGPPSVADADVDYLFLQVAPDNTYVSTAQNCGNILAGVGPFAIESGLVRSGIPTTKIRVHMLNSGGRCELTVQTPGGRVEYDGETVIDGVPGSAAEIVCEFLDVAGSATGSLLPTGNVTDDIGGTRVTCVDNGMPVVLISAADLGCTGLESPQALDADNQLKRRIEHLRMKVGPLMNLGDVSKQSVPKMCLVAAPNAGGHISTRTFIPHDCHRSIGVLGAVTVATACLLPGSVAAAIAAVATGPKKTVIVEHPSGAFQVRLRMDVRAAPELMVKSAGVIRTARLLMRGEVYVPKKVWDDQPESNVAATGAS